MCSYLHQRHGSPIYYFRRRVPDELRPIIGKREWLISLGTKDRAEAKRKIPLHTIATDAAIAEAREKLDATQVAEPVETPLAASPAPAIHAPFNIPEEQWDWSEEQGRESAAQDDRRVAREAEVLRLAARLRLPTKDLPETEAAMSDLLRELRERAETAERERDMAEARERTAKRRTETQIAAQPVEAAASDTPAISFTAMMEGYLAEAKRIGRMKPGTEISWRPRIQHFRDFLGHDDAARVTEDDVLKWLNKLEAEPGPKGVMLAPRTIKGYLSAVNATFKWGRQRGGLKANPALDVAVMSPRRIKAGEKGYTDAQAVKVLTAALKPAPKGMSKEYALARRWLPWLCAYTGARVGEIAQMRAKDLEKVGERWVLLITPEAGTVKDDQPRKVPLHPHLVELGFPALVDTYAPDATIFYTLSRSPNEDSARLYKKAGEKVGQMVRGLGITHAEIEKPNHAWRHRFKDEARLHGLDMEAADVIQGHTPPTVGRRDYGGRTIIEWMAREIDKLPRYVIPGLPEVSDPKE